MKCVLFVYVGYVCFACGFVSVVCFGRVIVICVWLCWSGCSRAGMFVM